MCGLCFQKTRLERLRKNIHTAPKLSSVGFMCIDVLHEVPASIQNQPVREITPVEQHLLVSLHHRTHPLLCTKERRRHWHRASRYNRVTDNKCNILGRDRKLEVSPSSRLVGIGTTTWELEALSSVTEPCRRLSPYS